MTMTMRIVPWLALPAALMATAGTAAASPRSERVAARVAERAYARQAIAEARAAQAEARVAQIAPLVPVPPPPRPATVRRMARAGVPLPPPPAVAPGSPQPVVIVVSAAEPVGGAGPQVGAGSLTGKGASPTSLEPRASTAAAAPAGGAPVRMAPQPTPGKVVPGQVAQEPVMKGPLVQGRGALSPRPVAPADPQELRDPGDVAPDGTRSVLVVGEEPEPSTPETTAPATDATIELLPVPEAR
jgi:hypothetical protein